MDSSWKTIDELMAGREWGEVKITHQTWRATEWFVPWCRCYSGHWYGLDQDKNSLNYRIGSDPEWKLYEEPKQPLYQWARLHQCNAWLAVDLLMTEEQVASDSSGAQYRKIGGPFYLDSNSDNEVT